MHTGVSDIRGPIGVLIIRESDYLGQDQGVPYFRKPPFSFTGGLGRGGGGR